MVILTQLWARWSTHGDLGPGRQIRMDSIAVDSLLEYVGFHKVRLGQG